MDIFVFGSNESGRHGKGAARFAYLKHGAIIGQGVGLQGYSYAIPTKDRNLKTLNLDKIKVYIDEFFKDAKINSVFTFNVTEIGCGYAGYTPEDIAPLFKDAMDIENIKLPARFLDILEGVQDYGWLGISMPKREKESFGAHYTLP
jgi:hypothetical protein